VTMLCRKFDGAYLQMEGEASEVWFDRRDVEITSMLDDMVIDTA
jgi:hypothetical protein